MVPVPGRLAGQSGEVREAHGVDGTVGVDDRRGGQLVEDDQDHRCCGAAAGRGGELRARHDVAGWRSEQEHKEREHGEHRQELAPEAEGRRANGQDPRRHGRHRRQAEGEGPDHAGQDLHRGQSDERADRRPVDHHPPTGRHHPGDHADPPDHDRRDEHHGEAEEHEVQPLGITEHEGLGALAERVEDRLGDRHPCDADQRREPSELDAEARGARRSRTTLLERAGLGAGQAAEPRRAQERPSLRADRSRTDRRRGPSAGGSGRPVPLRRSERPTRSLSLPLMRTSTRRWGHADVG